MPGPLGPYTHIAYTDGNGNVWDYTQRQAVQVALGNTVVARGAHNGIPRNIRPRKIHGVNNTGGVITRCTEVLGDVGNPHAGGTPFTKDGLVYTPTGVSAERIKLV